jgi:hypothetical protein
MDRSKVVYTKRMAQSIREIKKPFPGIIIDIAEYPEFLTIRMYEDNIMSFDINQRVLITDYISLVRKMIESYGVRCEFEGVPGDGRTKVQR